MLDTSLLALWLDCNRLTGLPTQLGNCLALLTLTLDKNQLTSLPSSLSRLSRSTLLTTPLSHRSQESGVVRFFIYFYLFNGVKNCDRLRNMTVRHNPELRSVPSELCMLTSLEHLSVDEVEGLSSEVLEQGCSAILRALRQRYDEGL